MVVAGKTILIVEDHADTREMLATFFKGEGFEVVLAADGGIGIDQAVGSRPDIIITDINMPNLDGLEMMRRLRANENIEQIPIIAVSARGSGGTRLAAAAGADRAIRKPIDFEALLTTVSDLLK